MKIWTDFSSVLSQFTHLTDRQTPFSSLICTGIPYNAEKGTVSSVIFDHTTVNVYLFVQVRPTTSKGQL